MALCLRVQFFSANPVVWSAECCAKPHQKLFVGLEKLIQRIKLTLLSNVVAWSDIALPCYIRPCHTCFQKSFWALQMMLFFSNFKKIVTN